MDTDGASSPFTTLLVRVAAGDEAVAVVEACFAGRTGATPPACTQDEVVVWVGDVAAPTAEPLAVAVVRFDGTGGVVTAAEVRPGEGAELLVDRLAHGLVEVASVRGCSTISADPAGVGDPGPLALLARSGLDRLSPSSWSVAP